MSLQTQREDTLFVTTVGGVVDIVLSCVKIPFGMLTHVHSITADGIHSLSDFVSDVILYICVKLSYQPASKLHPYGNRKLESLAALLIGAILVLTVLGMDWEALHDVRHAKEIPGVLSLLVIGLSIAAKEGLFWYTLHKGKQLKSAVLVANAWHNRADSLTSIMVLFCLIMGLLFGHMALWDVLGVAMVSVMILRAMVEIVRGSVKELLDYAPSEEVVNQIESLTDEHPEVSLVRDVRVRSVGGEYHVSLAIDIDGRATVRKADDIMQKVKTIIKKDIEDASYIIIQVAPAAEVVSEQG